MRALPLIFVLVLLAIVGVTTWASSELPIWETPRAVVTHPWFIATLTDTYLAFFTFWLWVAYREASLWRSALWALAIMLTGNMAMAVYVLIALYRLPRGAGVEDLLLRRR